MIIKIYFREKENMASGFIKLDVTGFEEVYLKYFGEIFLNYWL